MALLPLSLLLLAMFTASMVASYFQHKYYLRIVNDLARQYHRNGYVLASGRCKGRTRGAIAVVVVRRDDPDVIERALVMQGRTVFARFRERPEFAGRAREASLAACSPTMRRAVDDALQRGRAIASRDHDAHAIDEEYRTAGEENHVPAPARSVAG